MRYLALLILLVPLVGCGKAPSPPAQPGRTTQHRTSDPAADLVANFRMGAYLEKLANTVARSTVTYSTLPPARVADAIHRLVPRYQARWDANLAQAHARHLNREELRSLADKGAGSPYYIRLRQENTAIGTEMEHLSKGILQELVTEALVAASEPS